MLKYRMINWSRDNFPMVVVTTEMQDTVPIHTHDFVELVLFIEGSANHSVFAGDQKADYSVMQGDCFAILPGEAHAFENGRHAFYYNIIFSPSLIAREIKELKEFSTWMLIFGNRDVTGRNKIHLSLNDRIILNEYILKLIGELKKKQDGYKLSAKILLIEIMLLILRSVPQKMIGSQSVSRINPFILNIISEIEKKPEKHYTLHELAMKANMSSSGFSKKFKDIAGTSPVEYIILLRIEKAENLLISTDFSIYDIAEQCGFHDINYFIKVFRRYRGTTPAKFRKNSQKSDYNSVYD